VCEYAMVLLPSLKESYTMCGSLLFLLAPTPPVRWRKKGN
jgi:hypothetical protein